MASGWGEKLIAVGCEESVDETGCDARIRI